MGCTKFAFPEIVFWSLNQYLSKVFHGTKIRLFFLHFHTKKEVFKKKVYRRKVTGPSIFKGFKNNSWPVCLLLCPLVTSTKNDGKGRKPLKDSEWELGLSCRWCTCYYTVLHSRRSIFVLCHIFVTIHRVFWNLFPEWYRAQPFIRLHTIRRL